MDFYQFIIEEGLIMIAVLFLLGLIIKHTESISDKWIPVILLVISIFLTPLLLGGFTPMNIIQAILVTGAAVFTDQVIKQTQKREWQ